MSQLFRCAVVLLAILVFSQAELKAELFPAREHIGLIKLRGMIDDEGSVFERLWSWSEFASLNLTLGAQAKTVVHNVVESLDEHLQPTLNLPPILVVNHSRASNSRDSSSNMPRDFSANFTMRPSVSNPAFLLYWRGREFLCIPDAPDSGLFRPPRQLHFDSIVDRI